MFIAITAVATFFSRWWKTAANESFRRRISSGVSPMRSMTANMPSLTARK